MKINQQVLDIFTECKINKSDGLCYLISLFHGYTPSYIPDILKQKVNISGIVSVDRNNTYQWAVPLYNGGGTAFDWVKTEYVPMFKERNSSKGGKVAEATRRMKKLFADNPEIRKDDVINATRLYLRNTDPSYIRFPHYFIEKGVGADKTMDILDWIERYQESEDVEGRESKSNTMQ